MFDKNGKFLTSGRTDENGLTDRVITNEPTDLVVLIGDGAWEVEEYFVRDESDDSADEIA